MLNFLNVVSILVIGLSITIYLLLLLGVISVLVSNNDDATGNHQLLMLYFTSFIITTIFCVPSVLLYRITDKKLGKAKND